MLTIMSKKWSKFEEDFLMNNFRSSDLSEIARHLNRGCKSLQVKAYRLGLRRASLEPQLSLTNEEAAYIAGFIDGDGCIRMSVQYKCGQPKTVKPIIEITNGNKEVIEWIHKKLSQNCKTKVIRSLVENRYVLPTPHYHLIVAGYWRIKPLLERLLPYLRVKLKVAEAVLEFYQLRDAKESGKPPTKAMWRVALRARKLVNSKRAPHIRLRELLERFVTSLPE
uniref:Putative homing endonuclease n=1 Tax=viral metagenome TaxID=1070528 RepID=A0A6M3IDB6_9ZZZZ